MGAPPQPPKLGDVQLRYFVGGTVTSAAFSPDGSRVVTASEDGTARVWEAASGRELAVLRGHTDAVTFVKFDHDGSRVLTASEDATARIWDSVPVRQRYRNFEPAPRGQ